MHISANNAVAAHSRATQSLNHNLDKRRILISIPPVLLYILLSVAIAIGICRAFVKGTEIVVRLNRALAAYFLPLELSPIATDRDVRSGGRRG